MADTANKKTLIEKLKEKWNTLNPQQQKKAVVVLFAIGIIAVSLLGYMATHRGSNQETVKKETTGKTEEIKLDTGVLQKTQLAESQKEIEALKAQMEELKKEKEKESEKKKAEEEEKQKKEKMPDFKQLPPVPPPPPQGAVPPQGLPQGQSAQVKPPEPPKPEVIGGIGMVSQAGKKEEKGDARLESNKEKENATKKKFYLPSSFMEATILSGLDAPTVGKGDAHPVPVLLRIKAPAVLPNKVKANLKGCFIIAEGLGNLATERADLRLVSLSCIDRKGNAVIDQKIKGFIVDSDGKIGLRGRVVSKMGSTLARAFIAGLFSGLGQVAGTQAWNYNVTGSGTVSTIDPGKMAQAAIGSGIQSAANELQKFYLELARQAIPVVEIQATRNVTVVISEGVELEVKTYNLKD
jgi:conjugal transfer pilus assembly protein TraB